MCHFICTKVWNQYWPPNIKYSMQEHFQSAFFATNTFWNAFKSNESIYPRIVVMPLGNMYMMWILQLIIALRMPVPSHINFIKYLDDLSSMIPCHIALTGSSDLLDQLIYGWLCTVMTKVDPGSLVVLLVKCQLLIDDFYFLI
jgi:hypothetical protein